MEIMGLDAQTVGWYRSYLSSRSQTVCINGALARVLNIECGVRQGSVLGPLLYILLTNNLRDIVHNEHDTPLTHLNPSMQCDGLTGKLCR